VGSGFGHATFGVKGFEAEAVRVFRVPVSGGSLKPEASILLENEIRQSFFSIRLTS